VEKFYFSYAREISSFKITVPNELFSTICSCDFRPDSMVVKEFEAKIKGVGFFFFYFVGEQV